MQKLKKAPDIDKKNIMGKIPKAIILIIDDKPDNLFAFENVLAKDELKIFKAYSGNEALDLILKHDFALIIIDVQISGLGGIKTAEILRSNKKSNKIPIIFVTAIGKEQKNKFKGYESGIVDYIFKPVEPDIIRNKVNIFILFYMQKKKLETVNNKLENTIKELRRTNQKIITHQKSLIEEERLKVLHQMAGATAHEINQPLMALLGYIELIELDKDNYEKQNQHLVKVSESGLRIAKIVKKIQNIRNYELKQYLSQSSIIDLDQTINLLIIDKSENDFNEIQRALKIQKNIIFFRSKSINEALQEIKQTKFDFIFSEYLLPDGNALNLLNIINEIKVTVPIVIITKHGNKKIASEVINAGAYDYLPKSNISHKYLSNIIANAIEKACLKRETSTIIEKMAEISIKDELTGLFNRQYFMESVKRDISSSKRYGRDITLCLIDLDHFKTINDTYGYSVGDMVLAEFGTILKSSIRQSDLASRFEGKKFVLILPDTDSKHACLICNRLTNKLYQHKIKHGTSEISITVSIGIASLLNCDGNVSEEKLILLADKALCQAKKSGRNQIVNYGIEKVNS